MSTPVEAGLSLGDIAARAAGYGIAGENVDGNDIIAVRDATRSAHAFANNGKGPTLLECSTYRLSGHSRGDQRVYRSRQEEQEAWEIEPITRFEKLLIAQNILTESGAEEARQLAKQLIDEAVDFAEASPLPSTDNVTEGVFA